MLVVNRSDLITPALRARLGELELRSRRGGAAPGLGQHASRQRGSGLEFAQHRPYAVGDMPRQIDWQLYARSDRLYVREAERDSALDVHVLLDCSASMEQRDEQPESESRFSVAVSLAAALVELGWRQGDTLGLALLGQQRVQLVPAGSGNRMRERCQLALQTAQCAGSWPAASAWPALYAGIPPQALVLLLSDCFDPGLPELAIKLAHAGREVRVLQLLTASERDFNYSGGRLLIDPETAAELLCDAPAARASYLQAFAAAQATLAAQLRSAGVYFASHVIDQPLLPALAALADPLTRRRLPA
jgi:uncharacterized protein (DUF58 family)